MRSTGPIAWSRWASEVYATRGQRLVDEADDPVDKTRAVGGDDGHFVTGTDRQQPAEPAAEQQPPRGGNVVARPPGSTKRCMVVSAASPMRIVSNRFGPFVRVTSTRANGSATATAGSAGGGDEFPGVSSGGVQLPVGAVDGAVLTVQNVRDRVAQTDEDENETQRHRNTNNREAGPTTVPAEAAHHHPPPGGRCRTGGTSRSSSDRVRNRRAPPASPPPALSGRPPAQGPRRQRGGGDTRDRRDEQRRRVQRADRQRQAERLRVLAREPPAQQHTADTPGRAAAIPATSPKPR